MKYREYQPAPDLCPFVDRYWMLTGEALAADVILPDGHTELIAHFDTPPSHLGERQAACLWIGQMTAPVEIAPANANGCVWHPISPARRRLQAFRSMNRGT